MKILIDDFFDSIGDPRNKGKYQIWEPLILIITYLLIVRKIGPWFMKNRKPYNIKNIVVIFDAIQIAFNMYFIFGVFNVIRGMTGSYFCLENGSLHDENSKMCLFLTKCYYWLKISDLLDTIFFILKKNWRQASYLHVYHHSAMIIISWMGLKMSPGGHCAYFGLANSIVHTFMYFYYLLTAYDPSWKKNIALKKFITQIQLIQFVFIFIMYVPTLGSSCSLPTSIGLAAVSQSVYFMYLFGTFYYNTYIKINSGDTKQRASRNNND